MLRGEEVVFWYNVCVGWLVFVDRLIGDAGWKPAVPGEFAHTSVTLLNLQRSVSSTRSTGACTP